MTVVVLCGFRVVFFFKQKTAYEMRISDWSSDVCSSDLLLVEPAVLGDGGVRIGVRRVDVEHGGHGLELRRHRRADDRDLVALDHLGARCVTRDRKSVV